MKKTAEVQKNQKQLNSFFLEEQNKTSKKSISKNIPYIEKFKMIEVYTAMILNGQMNSLLIYGSSGIGKDYTVEKVLGEKALYIRGGLKGTYELVKLFYKYRENQIIVFSDCDSIFKSTEQKNILKTALEDKDVRRITYLDSSNRSKREKIPDYFTFTSGVIVISNKVRFDDAFRSRSIPIEIILNNNEKLELIKENLVSFIPKIPYEYRKEVFDYVYSIRKDIKNIDFRIMKYCVATYLAKLEEKNDSWKRWVKVILTT